MLKRVFALLFAFVPVWCLFGCLHSQDAIPVIEIYTSQATNASAINQGEKSDKYNCEKVLITNKNNTTEYLNVELKGRGNSTWNNPDLEKKPYQLSFSEEIDLFDLGSSKKWVLLANLFDKSSLRNKIVLDTASKIGLSSVDSIFVNLYINDKLLGVYQMCQKIDKTTVGLTSDSGALMEIDNLYGYLEEESYCLFNSKAIVIPKDASETSENDYQMLIDKLNEFESRLYNNENWDCISSTIDVDSWVRYYLIQELTQNRDCLRSSAFVFCSDANDTIHLGPVWDFDLALGSSIGPNNEGDPTKEYIKTLSDCGLRNLDWFSKLLEYPEFVQEISKIYSSSVKNVFEKIPDEIDKYMTIEFSEAITANNLQYSMFDESKNESYEEEIAELKNFIVQRIEWLDDQYFQK